MRVVDTSAWIEWLAGKPTSNAVRPFLPEPGAWLVPTIVQMELAKWVERTVPRSEADRIIAFSSQCVVVPFDSHLAWVAAAMCREHKLATADAIIYATAQDHGADLLTCDAHFSRLPGVVFVPKLTS